jgi:hypothetical protein
MGKKDKQSCQCKRELGLLTRPLHQKFPFMCSESDPTLGTVYTSRSNPKMFSMQDMGTMAALIHLNFQIKISFFVSFVRHYYLLQSHGNLCNPDHAKG